MRQTDFENYPLYGERLERRRRPRPPDARHVRRRRRVRAVHVGPGPPPGVVRRAADHKIVEAGEERRREQPAGNRGRAPPSRRGRRRRPPLRRPRRGVGLGERVEVPRLDRPPLLPPQPRRDGAAEDRRGPGGPRRRRPPRLGGTYRRGRAGPRLDGRLAFAAPLFCRRRPLRRRQRRPVEGRPS